MFEDRVIDEAVRERYMHEEGNNSGANECILEVVDSWDEGG